MQPLKDLDQESQRVRGDGLTEILGPSLDMATSTAQSFVPRGASARACGAAHIAAQQGNTGSLKLLFDLDRTFCSSNLCSGGVLW